MFFKMRYLILIIALISQNAFACLGKREVITDAYFDIEYLPSKIDGTTEIRATVLAEYKSEKLIKFELSGPGLWIPLGGQIMEFENGNKVHVNMGLPTHLLEKAEFYIGYGYTNCSQYYMVKKVEHNLQLKQAAPARDTEN